VPGNARSILYIHVEPKGQTQVSKGLPICIAIAPPNYQNWDLKNPLHTT
jgi:hypothetical protein